MKKLTNKGFTLIEIVIVLAIAALIMVIVFLAVQGAQRSQRDTATKNNAARTLAAAEQYASNNSGDYPDNVAAFSTYLTGITPAPENARAITAADAGKVFYLPGYECKADGTSAIAANRVMTFWWSETAGKEQCVGS